MWISLGTYRNIWWDDYNLQRFSKFRYKKPDLKSIVLTLIKICQLAFNKAINTPIQK